MKKATDYILLSMLFIMLIAGSYMIAFTFNRHDFPASVISFVGWGMTLVSGAALAALAIAHSPRRRPPAPAPRPPAPAPASSAPNVVPFRRRHPQEAQ